MFAEFIDDLINSLLSKGVCHGKLIVDNYTIHKAQIMRSKTVESGFELVLLPPYSPQLNPIEEVFSKWKQIIKTFNANTIEELNTLINEGANSITAEDCHGFFLYAKEFALKGVRREEF